MLKENIRKYSINISHLWYTSTGRWPEPILGCPSIADCAQHHYRCKKNAMAAICGRKVTRRHCGRCWLLSAELSSFAADENRAHGGYGATATFAYSRWRPSDLRCRTGGANNQRLRVGGLKDGRSPSTGGQPATCCGKPEPNEGFALLYMGWACGSDRDWGRLLGFRLNERDFCKNARHPGTGYWKKLWNDLAFWPWERPKMKKFLAGLARWFVRWPQPLLKSKKRSEGPYQWCFPFGIKVWVKTLNVHLTNGHHAEKRRQPFRL